MAIETPKKIHIVINPAAGKNEPILNILNRVFIKYDIDWSFSITKRYGDATRFARQAAEAGVDIVAAYGGDGTQHEVANGILGTGTSHGVLPGGTGNGFAAEMGTPKTLLPAVELLCRSRKRRLIDVVSMGDSFFVQRLYTGTEPEEQTSREDKDRYGTFAYVVNAYKQSRSSKSKQASYRVTVDEDEYEFRAARLYVVNAARAGTGLSVTGNYSKPDDGLVDVFVLSLDNLRTLSSAMERMLNIPLETAENFIVRGRHVTIETEPDQPVWTDGEFSGRTPVKLQVIPGALKVVVA